MRKYSTKKEKNGKLSRDDNLLEFFPGLVSVLSILLFYISLPRDIFLSSPASISSLEVILVLNLFSTDVEW